MQRTQIKTKTRLALGVIVAVSVLITGYLAFMVIGGNLKNLIDKNNNNVGEFEITKQMINEQVEAGFLKSGSTAANLILGDRLEVRLIKTDDGSRAIILEDDNGDSIANWILEESRKNGSDFGLMDTTDRLSPSPIIPSPK